MNKKSLQYLRLVVQVAFVVVTVLGLKFGTMLYKRLAMFAAFLFIGTYFCGWVCPFGTVQELLWKINRRFIKREITIPWKIDRWLSWLRYVTLFVALGAVINVLDARRSMLMRINGGTLTTAAIVCLVVVLVLSLFMRRPFCRYICPEGARYGIAGMSRLFTVTRNEKVCVNCKACDRACPMAIPVSQISEKDGLNSPQCISCASCLSACPKSGALSLKFRRLTSLITLLFFLVGMYFLVSSVRFTLKRFNAGSQQPPYGAQNHAQPLRDGQGPHGMQRRNQQQ